ncbi:MAG: sigma-E processing peptidase SpoIIGA [Schaedlerella sp.]|nr:sigma-E processing peptidase SpoIIGA [Schaedlerella sp.]
MNYEIYIDVLFLENFMMDSLLLLSISKLQRIPIKYTRIMIGAMAGSVLTCSTILLNIPIVLKYMIANVMSAVIMVFVGLKQRDIYCLIRSTVLLYIISVLYGGIMLIFRPYIRNVSIFYSSAVISYIGIDILLKILTRVYKQSKDLYKVSVFTTKGVFQLQALGDTGNTLTDPVTKEPVTVIDKKIAEQILGLKKFWSDSEETEFTKNMEFRYIRYRTIGGENIMPMVRIDKMIVHTDRKIEITKPLIGICEEPVSERQIYQMILNSDILGGAGNVSENNDTTEI